MKYMYILLVLLAVSVVACTKSEKRQVRLQDIVGWWDGKYSESVGSAMNQDIMLRINADSTVRVYDQISDTTQGRKGSGVFYAYDYYIIIVWQWEGAGSYYMNGEFTADMSRFSGNWGMDDTDQGTFYVDKQR